MATSLSNAPATTDGSRAFMGETGQAELLPPDTLAEILQQLISRIRMQRFTGLSVIQERREQKELLAWLRERYGEPSRSLTMYSPKPQCKPIRGLRAK
jgi:hypothetical protein